MFKLTTLDKIVKLWENTEAFIMIEAITSKDDFPSHKICPENHLYIGYIESSNYLEYDPPEEFQQFIYGGLYIVRPNSQITFAFLEHESFNTLDDQILEHELRLKPEKTHCTLCGCFSTNLHHQMYCRVCADIPIV